MGSGADVWFIDSGMNTEPGFRNKGWAVLDFHGELTVSQRAGSRDAVSGSFALWPAVRRP